MKRLSVFIVFLFIVGVLPTLASGSPVAAAGEFHAVDQASVSDPCDEHGDNGPISAAEAAREAALCAARPAPPEPPPAPLTCVGAVLCMASEAEVRAAGLDVDAMRRDDRAELASIQARVHSSGTLSSSYYGGWVNFYLYYNSHCSGTKYYNGYCGWLYHRYYDDGSGWVYTTSFPARSGNNVPADDWKPSKGPIPNDHRPPGSSVTNRYTWGFMYGAYRGYEPDSSSSFDPGKWRLDPWSVNKPGTDTYTYERSEFEIHG
ncbi:MAG TPA: hypothetical protein ENH33_04630, partial [Actinobacteria bacterium]|nr:hypothetical protein [Actinomycetota bacterium]